jgi:hypothetical protein
MFPLLVVDEKDREQKCTLEKQVRYRIGSKYPDVLKWQGLTKSEWVGKQRYENLSDYAKEVIRTHINHVRAMKRPNVSACQNEQTISIVLDGVRA